MENSSILQSSSHCLLANEVKSLRITLLALGISSVLACLLIVWGFIRMERKPDPLDPSCIMLFLSISDLMLAVVAVLDGSNAACSSNQLCLFKAIISQYFGFASFLWTASMSHSSYITVSQLFLPQTADHTKLMKIYHGICWGVPACTAVLMLLTSTLAPTGYVCSLYVSSIASFNSVPVSMDHLQLVMHIVIFFLPLLLVELFNLYVFRFLANTLRNLPRSNDLLMRFTRYLVVVIAIKAVFLLTRLKSIVAPGNQALALLIFVMAGPPLQGLGDYLIYTGGREQNRFTHVHGHENNSSTHSAIALTSITRDQEMSGDYIRSSSTRGVRDDDDEDNQGMENGHRVAGVVLNPFYVPGMKGGRHSLIHNDTSNNGREILVAEEEDNSINSRSQLDDKDTGQSNSP